MTKAKEFLSIVEEDTNVAMEILRQLGGNKFIAMTGAKNMIRDDNEKSLRFKIGRNSSKANWVKIVLNGMDTYDVSFMQFRNNEMKTLKTYNNIYNDQLQNIFTDYTGMQTSLGTMGR